MSAADLRRLLRRPLAELVHAADPLDPGWAGILWEPLPEHAVHSDFPDDLSRRSATSLDLFARGLVWCLSFHPQLSSGAATPFELDGERHASVESFYLSLKFPEGSPGRAQCAAAQPGPRRRAPAAEAFVYAGRRIAVGSRDHAELVARAIAAKVEQNPAVERALADSRRALLVLNRWFRPGRQVLGRWTPFMLMVERWRRSAPVRE